MVSFNLEACLPHQDLPQIGYLCSYTPVEIIYAAGFQPVRLSTNGEPIKVADGYMHNTVCIYVRNILDRALGGYGEGLSAMIFINSCDAMRRLCDIWRYYVGTRFVYFMDLPRTATPYNIERYKAILRDFIQALEDRFGVRITEERLRSSIEKTNKMRKLLQRLMALRQVRGEVLTSRDLFPLLLASTKSNIDLYNQELESFISAVEGGGLTTDKVGSKPRVLLTGSVIDRVEMVETLESFGIAIVVEDTCTGVRLSDFSIKETGDPLEAIAVAYLRDKMICARMKGLRRRIDYLLDLMDRYHIDGLISYTLKFCDPELMFYPLLKRVLEERGIPHLHLEGDGTIGGLGQLRTRIEAFVEMLGVNPRWRGW